MDILLLRTNHNASKIVDQLVDLQNTSIYLALDENDALRIAENVKPIIAIVGSPDSFNKKIFQKAIVRKVFSEIYLIENENSEEFILYGLINNKHIGLKKLVNQINKGGLNV